jgi:hypothetical protein
MSGTPAKTRSIVVDGYEILASLGSGTYGKVFKVRRIEDGAILVMKQVPLLGLTEREQMETLNEVLRFFFNMARVLLLSHSVML